jgi:hypothetical protein
VAVVPLDRAEQGGHFDTKMGIWLWLLVAVVAAGNEV